MCINFAFGLVILKQMEYNNIRRIADIIHYKGLSIMHEQTMEFSVQHDKGG